MKKIVLYILILIGLLGCNSSKSTDPQKVSESICPQCNMPFSTNKDSGIYKDIKFDDIGCMVLWAKKHNVDLLKVDTKIYLNKEGKFIDSKKAFYRIDGKTPMKYGFVAVLDKCDKCITFDEVIIKMLRGEHLANPKIRKKVLGY